MNCALIGVETLHNQISHLIVLMIELLKHVGLGNPDVERLETEKAK
jgi:predicted Zn-dependent protease with MMP-like domain